MPSITGGHHIALTVSDADRSAEWYCSLLIMQWQKELSSRGITFTPITRDGH
jgi:catechol 2,3-dioxygenase-like lactoylglutathione lyase family enzyme